MKSIWKKALAILLVAILTCGAAPAAGWLAVIAAAAPVGGTCGADGSGLTWSLDTQTGVLTVSGTGDMADYDTDDNLPPWAQYADSIVSVVIEAGATSVGDNAFFGCSSLTSVSIGTDVTRIGTMAFTMTALSEAYVPASVQEIGIVAFGGLLFTENGITPTTQRIDVDPANAVFSSADGVLYDKAQTTLLEYPAGNPASAFRIPDGVTEIAYMAFAYCIHLESVTFPDSLTTIGPMAFSYCSLNSVTIPGSVTAIGEDAFYECRLLESVTIENGVTQIPAGLFAGLENIESVSLPDSVTTIGDYAFNGCASLEDLTLGSGVETIGVNAFYACSSLQTLTIPQNVTSIGSYAFYGCTALTSLTFNAAGCADMSNVFIGSSAIQTLVIGNGVTRIPAGAFTALEGVTSVTIPNSVTSIGTQAFLSCQNLEDVTIGAGVETIGDYAFQNCTALASIHIPSGVTAIGSSVFENCTNLAYICSDSASAYAKTYAEANGIEFRLCSGHGGEQNTVSGECGAQGSRVTWTLDLDTNVLTISGTGAMADYTSGTQWESYRAYIDTVIIEDGVTRIGVFDFREFESLAAVTIADSVTAIGASAFEGCASLVSVTLGRGLTTIGESAFKETGLPGIFLPRSVTQIGADALTCGINTAGAFTPTLAQIDVSPENEVYSAQDGVLYNKEKTELILYPAANPRTSFDIPDSVETIGSDAFRGCVNLTEAPIPDSVTAIGSGAFRGCAGLAEMTIPDSVTAVGNYAFAGCTGLQTISVPGSLTAIGEGVFSGCTGLESVTGGSGVVSIGKQAFEACTGLTAIEFPDSVTSVGESAFSDCTSLVSVTFGSGVSSIGRLAFCNTGLVTVTIPEKVTRIEGSTFADCSSLTHIHIPFTVVSISESALADCGSLSFICSDTADCYARIYAQANDIDFRLCTGHENDADTISGSCGVEGDNVLWALNLGSGRMILSGSGDMADYAGSADTPWADRIASIQSVDVRSGVTNIGDYAFADCAPLQSVTIGEDVTRIGTGAFASSALTSVAVPASVTQIGTDAFACGIRTQTGFVPTLQRIDVEPESMTFFSKDGVLFNRSRTMLILYPAAAQGGLYDIPNTVKRIESGAFRGSQYLMRVHVPYSVTQIGENAFADCAVLTYLCCDIAGSCAETYAADNGIEFRFCDGHKTTPHAAGDANGDGSIDLKDVILIRRYLAGGWDNVVIYGMFADVDADGSITLQDVTLISRYLAGGWNVVLL